MKTHKSACPWLTTARIGALYGVKSSTVLGWMKRGVDTPLGRIQLQSWRIGGRWKSRVEWVEEFFRLCGGGDRLPVMPETNRQADARARQYQAEARRAQARAARALGQGKKRKN